MDVTATATAAQPRVYERFGITGKLVIPFGFDGYISPGPHRVCDAQGYQTLDDAIGAAQSYARDNHASAVVYELPADWKTPAANGPFVIHEGFAGPGGLTDATAGRYELGNPVESRGTKPTKFQFTDSIAKALVGAQRVLTNESGHDKVRF